MVDEESPNIPLKESLKACLTCGKLSTGEVCSIKCQKKYAKNEENKAKQDLKEKNKAIKKQTKKISPKRLAKIEAKLIDVEIDGKKYRYPKTMIFDYCPKEYKIEENKKKIQEGEIGVLYLREGGTGMLKYVKPENGMYIVDGRYYHRIGSCNFTIGKKRLPLAVIPEWSFVPLSRKEYETKLGSKYQDAQGLIIKSLENAEIVKINQDLLPKKAPNGKLIIWIIIGAVVGLFILNRFFGGA